MLGEMCHEGLCPCHRKTAGQGNGFWHSVVGSQQLGAPHSMNGGAQPQRQTMGEIQVCLSGEMRCNEKSKTSQEVLCKVKSWLYSVPLTKVPVTSVG